MERVYLQNSGKVKFDFFQNEKDFIVDEIPHANYKGKGNFLILHVKKVEMTTWDMIAVFAKTLNIPAEKIGYAGLKDKHATTTQYISVEVKYDDIDDLKSKVEVGVDGIILKLKAKQATFLPQVWEDLNEFDIFLNIYVKKLD